MNESKTKIVIASVLKPVDDIRNFKKIATSLVKDEKHQVTILGVASTNEHSHPHISFRTWANFRRLSFGRIRIQFEYRRRLRELKPGLIICTTFELLFTSLLFRMVNGTKIVYDIQEDYLKNLWFQTFYPWGVRHLMGLSVRSMEALLSPFISGFTLAEKTYQKDIDFCHRKFLIIENKSLHIPTHKNSGEFKVIFTGTISSYSRAVESIELYLHIHEQLPKSTLTLIGYVPVSSYQNLLEARYKSHPNINLRLSNSSVPHAHIIEEICTADLAIIGYTPNPVNSDKVPTKLYEYTAAKLPYLVQAKTHWANLGKKFGGAIPIEFNDPNSTDVMKELNITKDHKFVEKGFFWKENESELLHFIADIIN